jgi:hypothetical protein
VSAPIGAAAGLAGVCLLGDGDRASTVLATGDFAPVTGSWVGSRLENLVFDAGSHGGRA